jgi:hypothetical protein
MSFNEDGNLMGRVVALALLVGAAAGVRGIARGSACPFCFGGESAVTEAPSSVSAPDASETR